jgi:HAMP domain-containing protein
MVSMGGSRPPPLPRPVEPVRQGFRRGWLRLGALVLAGLLLALFMRRVVPAAPRPTSDARDDETSGMLRPSPEDDPDQPAPERAQETSERADEPSEEATEEPSEEATEESSEEATQASSAEATQASSAEATQASSAEASLLRSRVREPHASTSAPEPSVRPAGRYQSEQIFASTEQSTAFADTRRGPRRSERSYRLDVEGAPITRSDNSASPRSRLAVNRVRDALRRSAGQLERCCDAALRASLLRARAEAPRAAAAAQLRVHGLAAWFSVQASGATSGVRMEGDAPEELITCIRGTVERWKLPGLATGVELRVGLEFAGAAGAPVERQ